MRILPSFLILRFGISAVPAILWGRPEEGTEIFGPVELLKYPTTACNDTFTSIYESLLLQGGVVNRTK